MISAEEFAEWKEHPVTREIFKDLKEVKETLKEKLENGDTIGYKAAETHGSTNRIVGHLDGINQLLNIHYAAEEASEEDNQDVY